MSDGDATKEASDVKRERVPKNFPKKFFKKRGETIVFPYKLTIVNTWVGSREECHSYVSLLLLGGGR